MLGGGTAHQKPKQKQYFALFSVAQPQKKSIKLVTFISPYFDHSPSVLVGVFRIMPFELFHFDFCWHFLDHCSLPLLSLFFTASFGNCLIYCCSNAVKMQPTKRLKTVNIYLCVVKSNLPKAQSSNALHCCNRPISQHQLQQRQRQKKECPNMANDGATERSDLQL